MKACNACRWRETKYSESVPCDECCKRKTENNCCFLKKSRGVSESPVEQPNGVLRLERSVSANQSESKCYSHSPGHSRSLMLVGRKYALQAEELLRSKAPLEEEIRTLLTHYVAMTRMESLPATRTHQKLPQLRATLAVKRSRRMRPNSSLINRASYGTSEMLDFSRLAGWSTGRLPGLRAKELIRVTVSSNSSLSRLQACLVLASLGWMVRFLLQKSFASYWDLPERAQHNGSVSSHEHSHVLPVLGLELYGKRLGNRMVSLVSWGSVGRDALGRFGNTSQEILRRNTGCRTPRPKRVRRSCLLIAVIVGRAASCAAQHKPSFAPT